MAYSRAMRRPLAWGDPSNRCYGCGPHNPQGLRLSFFETDEGVEIDYTAPDHVEGAPGIVHGGVQATLLDEAFCMTVHAKHGRHVVTGELTVRYRRPVPTGTPLLVRGRIVEAHRGRFVVEGGIHLAGTDEELTRGRGQIFVPPEDP